MPVFTPIPHDAVVAAVLTLRDAIAAGDWRPDTIVGIGRGGLVPAALVARELDIRLIDTVCVVSYGSATAGDAENVIGEPQVLKGFESDGAGWLLIDDLVDTGKTAQLVRRMIPKAHFATLYAKPSGRPVVDTFVKEFKQNKWIHFPWDIEYQFSTPIKDRPQLELKLPVPDAG